MDHRITDGKMENSRASSFTVSEQQLLMEVYEEVKHIIRKKGNTTTIIKEREKAWQTIADRLNATNLSGQKRTWQQVKIKYKNILQAAVKKKNLNNGTGGGPPSQDLAPAEELAPYLNKDSVLSLIQVSGNTLTLLEPLEDDPGEGTSAAADDETVSLDSRRLEDPDAAQSPKPGNFNSQIMRRLYTKHLEKQIELADVQITLKKRKLLEVELDLEIKRRTLKKLNLEIKKLEEVPSRHMNDR